MTSRTLTALICTHNRSSLLLRTLHYLNMARRPQGWRVDILVVANACTDNSLEDLVQFHEKNRDSLPLNWIEEPTAGKSFALNSALPLITSELVAFVDDDHRVDSEYLASICAAAEEYPDAELFCGRILPDWDGSEPAWIHETGAYRIYPLPIPRFDQGEAPLSLTPEIAIPGGGNLFLRTEWLSRIGPFSTELGPTGHDLEGSEDLDWVLRAQDLGARLQYVPSVVQYHYVDLQRLRLGYLIKKAYKRTVSTTALKAVSEENRVPRYLYRKLGEYLFFALTALSTGRRRFYLVRTAAALGEIKGYRQRRATVKPLSNKKH
ncbi:MAG TPA: glycosyltransferase [Gammaproteobacteria bacterium]|nr:glycosyltransferase [Gammaproteobacteria bacterium]